MEQGQHLHWLPVKQRIQYKLGLLVYKCLHGLALPYLTSTYCVLAWSPHYVKDQERVQHRFMRMVPGLRGLEYRGRLERLKLITLEESWTVQIWSNCSRFPKDRPPSHGIPTYKWKILIGQENKRTFKEIGEKKFQIGYQKFVFHNA